VDDAPLVGVLDGVGQRLRQGGGQPRRLRPSRDAVLEVAAGDVFQGEEGPLLVQADLVDLDDVGVLEAGDGIGLDAETDDVFG
jgi:hypothetical protein